MKNPKQKIISLCGLTIGLACVLALNVSAQSPVVIFQDGFENGIPGSSPATNEPTVGSYLITSTTASPATNAIQVLTGPTTGGPDGAVEGTNYLMIDRNDYPAVIPVLQCLFSTPFFATNAPFHAQFYLWAPITPSNWPQFTLGSGIAVSSAAQLSYNSDVIHNTDPIPGAWEWYDGSYHITGSYFSISSWDLVEIDWDGTSLTGKINGASVPLGMWGSSDKIINQLVFRCGVTSTIFYVDDIKVTATAPILVSSVQPTPNATVAVRQPTVGIQLEDVSQSVDLSSIQLYFNNVQVTPTITQSSINGFNVTIVSYVPPVLPYGSTNTVQCLFSDEATPADQYSKVWQFKVYSSDTIFSDNYESSLPQYFPFHNNAAAGTNCLTVARIGAGRPYLDAAADPNEIIGDSDTLTLTVNFGAWENLGQNGVLAVIPEYVTNNNGQISFNQTGQINLLDDGRVSVVDLTGKVNQYLTAKMNTNAWNTITIQYVNGSAYWSVSVNGSPFEGFYGKSSTGGSAYGNVNGFHLATAGNGWTWCDNITLSNTTADTLLFTDGFENTPAGSPPATTSPSVGSYVTVFPDSVPGGLLANDGVYWTNTAPLPPNAPQVGTYDTNATSALVLTGTGHGGTKYVALTNGTMEADFITPIPSGVLLHAQAWLKYQAGQVGWGFAADGTDQFATVTLADNSSVYIFDGTNQVDTGFTHGTGAWEECQLDYVVGAPDITVTYNGSSTTVPIAASSTINGLFFVEDQALSSSANVDDVSASAQLGNLPVTDPLLQATLNGDQIIVSWTNGAGYVLQSNSDLSNPNGWVNVPAGGISPVQVPAVSAAFYRLTKPL